MRFEQLSEMNALEHFAADQHFVQTTTQRIQIRFAGDCRIAGDLFGGHVGVGADGHAGAGQIGQRLVACDTEIAQLEFTRTRQKQIAGFEIAVDDAVVVGTL